MREPSGVTLRKTRVNCGRVIRASSQNKACLWEEAEAEGKSSRGKERKLERLTISGKDPKQLV